MRAIGTATTNCKTSSLLVLYFCATIWTFCAFRSDCQKIFNNNATTVSIEETDRNATTTRSSKTSMQTSQHGTENPLSEHLYAYCDADENLAGKVSDDDDGRGMIAELLSEIAVTYRKETEAEAEEVVMEAAAENGWKPSTGRVQGQAGAGGRNGTEFSAARAAETNATETETDKKLAKQMNEVDDRVKNVSETETSRNYERTILKKSKCIKSFFNENVAKKDVDLNFSINSATFYEFYLVQQCTSLNYTSTRVTLELANQKELSLPHVYFSTFILILGSYLLNC